MYTVGVGMNDIFPCLVLRQRRRIQNAEATKMKPWCSTARLFEEPTA